MALSKISSEFVITPITLITIKLKIPTRVHKYTMRDGTDDSFFNRNSFKLIRQDSKEKLFQKDIE